MLLLLLAGSYLDVTLTAPKCAAFSSYQWWLHLHSNELNLFCIPKTNPPKPPNHSKTKNLPETVTTESLSQCHSESASGVQVCSQVSLRWSQTGSWMKFKSASWLPLNKRYLGMWMLSTPLAPNTSLLTNHTKHLLALTECMWHACWVFTTSLKTRFFTWPLCTVEEMEA